MTKSKAALEERVAELYLVAFSRKPRADELKVALEYLNEPRLNAAGKPVSKEQALRENFQDVIWALMNTKEFSFNH